MTNIKDREHITWIIIPKKLNQYKVMEQILRNIIEEHFPEIKKDLMVSILFWVMVYNYTKLSKVHQTEQLRYMHFIICFTVGKNLCIENLELY